MARVEEAMHAKGAALLMASLLLVALVGSAVGTGRGASTALPTAVGAGRASSTAGGGLVKGRGVGG